MGRPRVGLRAKSGWFEPIVKFRCKVKPKEGKFAALFPYVPNDWVIDYKRAVPYGVVQARLDVLVGGFGFSQVYMIHSFRNWGATCARQ